MLLYAVVSLCFLSTTARKVAIGIIDHRFSWNGVLNHEKFWNFGQNYSPDVALEPTISGVYWWNEMEVLETVCNLSESGMRGLFASPLPKLQPMMASIAERFQIPLVSVAQPSGENLNNFQVTLLPETDRAIASLLQFYGWKSFAFLYHTKTGAGSLSRILQASDSVPFVSSFLRIDSDQHARHIIENLTESAILLAAPPNILDSLVSSWSSSKSYHFILTTPVAFVKKTMKRSRHRVTKLSVSEINSTVVQEIDNRWRTLNLGHREQFPEAALYYYDAAQIFLDVFQKLAPEVVEAKGSSNCFNYSSGIPQAATALKQVVLEEGATGKVQFNEKGERVNFELKVYEETMNSLQQVGQFLDISGLNMWQKQPPTFSFRRDEPVIIVTSIIVEPFLMQKDPKFAVYEGYVADLVDELMAVMNRKYRIEPVKDGYYGMLKNGRWNGMVGALVNKDADLAVAPLTKIPKREAVIDFGPAFLRTGLVFLVKKTHGAQDRKRLEPFSFLTVCTPEFWLMVLVFLAIFAGCGYAVGRFIGSPDRVRALESKGTDSLSPCGSVWYTVGGFVRRDTGIYPRVLSHRIWAVLWWTFCILVLIGYVALLTEALIRTRTTVLTTHAGKTSHELMKEALEIGSPALGALKTGTSSAFFLNSNIGIYSEYGRYLTDHPEILAKSYAEGVQRVRESNGSYAFLMESQSAEYEANLPPCDVLLSSGFLTTRTYAISMQKNSTYKSQVEEAMLTLTETGALQRLYEKWWHNTSAGGCDDPYLDILPEVYNDSLTLHEISGLFYVLMIGALISLIVAGIEYFLSSRRVSLE